MPDLKDRLAYLTYREACKLLGPEGERLIRQGGSRDIDTGEQVTWGKNLFRVHLGEAVVTLTLEPERPKRLRFSCSKCSKSCEHLGAVFPLILEEKLALGLSAPPPEKQPVETLSDQELLGRAIEERTERAKTEKMRMLSKAPNVLWTDYAVTSYGSGKTYRVALRGWERGDSYCSCPDFRKNTLGVCKHIFFVMNGVRKRFDRKAKNTPFQPQNTEVHLL